MESYLNSTVISTFQIESRSEKFPRALREKERRGREGKKTSTHCLSNETELYASLPLVNFSRFLLVFGVRKRNRQEEQEEGREKSLQVPSHDAYHRSIRDRHLLTTHNCTKHVDVTFWRT